MKVLVFSDPHISFNSLLELEKTFTWILNTAKEYKIDTIIMCGDYYDKKTPHIQAFLFGTKWAKVFVDEFEKVVFLNGNHDNIQDTSNLEYLKYLGVEVVDEYVLQDKNYLGYFGHFFVKQSPINYGKDYKDLKDLKVGRKKFVHIILGHYHDFMQLSNNAWHIGATRYVSFGENEEINKKIAIIDTKEKDILFLDIPTVIPIRTVCDLKELNKTPKKTKVRIVFNSFADYKKVINLLDKYKSSFVEFKVKMNFQEKNVVLQDKYKNQFDDFALSWLEQIKEEKVKEILTELFKKYGLI